MPLPYALIAKSTAVLIAAAAATLVLRRSSAAARHLVWTIAFLMLLLLPVLSVTVPALPMPAAAMNVLPALVASATAVAGLETRVAPPVMPSAAPAHQQRAVDWTGIVLIVWAAGTAVLLLRLLVSWAIMLRIRRAAMPMSHPALDPLARSLGLRTPVELRKLPEGSMPLTFGIFRPVVLLPAEAAAWSDDRLRIVLLHELAHLCRRDPLWQLAARAALTLHWWNPLAWFAWRGFLRERENATDDLVLNAGARASDYAGHLFEMARSLRSPLLTTPAALAFARRSQLEARLAAILDARRKRNAPGRSGAIAAALLAAALVLPLAAFQAQSVPSQPIDVDAAIRSAASQNKPAILEDAAAAASAQRNYDVARRLLDAAASIQSRASGPDSPAFGQALIRLGDLERRRGNMADAVMFYSRAVNILGDRAESAPAHIQLGIAAIGRKDLDAAIAEFQKAGAADPAVSLTWSAVARARQGRTEEAAALYEQALGLERPDSKQAQLTARLYEQLLTRQGRPELAAAVATRVPPSSKKAVPFTEGVYRVGDGVTRPELVSKTEPQYTEEARAALLEGTNVLYVEIGPDGIPRNIQIVRAVGLGLDDNAIDAVSQWRFRPGTKDGQPVTVSAMIEVNWRLM